MLTLNTPAEAEKFVRRQVRLGNDVRWDGWEIVFFRPAPTGVYSKHGARRVQPGASEPVWGFENRVPVTDSGTWEVDFRNVVRAQRSRN